MAKPTIRRLKDPEFVDFNEFSGVLASDIRKLEEKLGKMKRAYRIFKKLAADQILNSSLKVTEI